MDAVAKAELLMAQRRARRKQQAATNAARAPVAAAPLLPAVLGGTAVVGARVATAPLPSHVGISTVGSEPEYLQSTPSS